VTPWPTVGFATGRDNDCDGLLMKRLVRANRPWQALASPVVAILENASLAFRFAQTARSFAMPSGDGRNLRCKDNDCNGSIDDGLVAAGRSL